MSLSVCLMAAGAPARAGAILDPLRSCADEVLIAADSRTDEHTLAGYSALSDRLIEIDAHSYEQGLGRLRARCSGDWILQLNSDELASEAFVRRLPELLRTRTVQQFWISRRWLFGDGRRCIAEHPWTVDFVGRLVRNDGTLPPRALIPPPTTPHEYVTEPLYNLELLLEDERRRRDKVILREIVRPGLTAIGGGRLNEALYLPELRGSVQLRAVPEQDRAPIASALAASGMVESPRLAERQASCEAMEHLERRAVGGDARWATIEAYEPTVSFSPAETRPVYFEVSNESPERWPASLEQTPLIRLGYRWLNLDGTLLSDTEPRSAFPRPVGPGERVLAAVHAQAPAELGDYLLEVDVVHENVRWLGCQARVAARVLDPRDLPQGITPIRVTRRPARRRWQRMRIPRTVHRVWLGGRPMGEQEVRFGLTFAHHNPGWTMRLWTDADLPSLEIYETERERARSPSELSNLVRYEVLHRFGGIYVDTDFECLRPLTPVLRGIDAFTALELPGRVGAGILGSVPGHPLFARAARLTRETLGTGAHSADANGPYFFSLLLEQGHDLTIFETSLFYPYSWDEQVSPDATFPDAYAVHHWAKSWVAEERGS